jgi:ribosome-binding ATPase YchF (GTP1/OBG family)
LDYIGSTAPQAAVIHTDFEKDLFVPRLYLMKIMLLTVPEAKAKEAGKFKVEGKEYIVKMVM